MTNEDRRWAFVGCALAALLHAFGLAYLAVTGSPVPILGTLAADVVVLAVLLLMAGLYRLSKRIFPDGSRTERRL